MANYTGNRPGAATAPNFDGATSSTILRNRQADRAALRQAALERQIAEERNANRIIRQARLSEGLTPEEQKHFTQQAQRSERARAAQKRPGPARKPKRSEAACPPPSKMFIPAISADAARDRGLSMGARTCLGLIVALSRKKQAITKAGLASLLGVSIRTVQRYLSALADRGYVARELLHSSTGWVIGQIIKVAEKVLPFFLRLRHWNGGFPGVTEMSPINCLSAVNPLYSPAKLVQLGFPAGNGSPQSEGEVR